jgi:hypothetical protein
VDVQGAVAVVVGLGLGAGGCRCCLQRPLLLQHRLRQLLVLLLQLHHCRQRG